MLRHTSLFSQRCVRHYTKILRTGNASKTYTPSPAAARPAVAPKPSVGAATETESGTKSSPAAAVAFEATPSGETPSELQAEVIQQLRALEQQGEDNSAWGTSYDGLSAQAFPEHIAKVLLAPLAPTDIEIKPDGIVYLPEIKYRRILNRSLGPGGWGLVPRGPHTITERTISREYALIGLGRFVSQARGEQDFFDAANGLATASEGCKSNALMRCCKDLGIASELWDPAFIPKFKKQHCVESWAVHMEKGNKKKVWRRKDRTIEYPWKEA
ncbi:hypothetical protein IWQ60_010776 [Tieghemiomyces parasiticus]|uniref:Mitochondrial genome maintenance protein MGM101 n=1 Tax=Tieghemiomyces parasiticus TaxID=78921 RepID=A0A9W7ZKV9_9FUNG|nr:hypothetical protein IWQ60_010776 [Tieghemiomyces parasiticus]